MKGRMKYLYLLGLAALAGCATVHTLSPNLKVSTTGELLGKMKNAATGASSLVAEARMTYFEKGKRLKGTATIVSKRPGNLRYEILGPHGGVLEAFATNGKELQIAKLAENRFLYGPATPELLDQLLPFAPLNMTSTGWVNLLFGQVDIPSDAALRYDEIQGQFVLEFQRGATSLAVNVHPKTAQIHGIKGSVEGKLQYEVDITTWAPQGIPQELRITVPSEELEVRLELRDIELNKSLDESLFVLDPLPGIASEYLGY